MNMWNILIGRYQPPCVNSNNNRKCSFQLQDPGVTCAQRTLAILCSKLMAMNMTIDELKVQRLEPFVKEHEGWCKQVSAFVLGKKKSKWEHYKAEWLADAFPLDKIGITFFARCFRRHICVFVNSHYWTTHVSNDIEQCSIFLAYRGRVSFKNFFSVAQPGYHLTKLSSLRENLVAQLEKKRCLILNIF